MVPQRSNVNNICDTFNRAVFIDRDGTLIDEMGYLGDPSGVVLYPGAGEAVACLNRRGLLTVVVSNQSGVARGFFGEDDVERCMERLQHELSRWEGHVDRIEYCPHHPTEGSGPYTTSCRCRKPAIGMIKRSSDALNIDVQHSFVVGDSVRDMEMAARAGAVAVLVLTGHGKSARDELDKAGVHVAYVASSVVEAVDWILAIVKEEERCI